MNTVLETKNGTVVEVAEKQGNYILRVNGKNVTTVDTKDRLRVSHLVRFMDLLESEISINV